MGKLLHPTTMWTQGRFVLLGEKLDKDFRGIPKNHSVGRYPSQPGSPVSQELVAGPGSGGAGSQPLQR